MKAKLYTGCVIAVLFTIGWHAYWQSAQTRAGDRGRTGMFGTMRSEIEGAGSTRRTGLWIGGVASALFLLAALGASSSAARKKCPHCAEDVAAAAKVCKHCRRDLVAV